MSEQNQQWQEQMLAEMKRQTAAINRLAEINLQLVEALAEQDEEQDTQPRTYLDGSPSPIIPREL